MTQRDPVSIFFGPHRGFEDLAQWPPTIELHLQLHGLQPGDLTTPPLNPTLFDPPILTPTPGNWRAIVSRISYLLIHTILEQSLTVLERAPAGNYFFLETPFAITRWAYNQITDPAGVSAFGGSATLSWKEP